MDPGSTSQESTPIPTPPQVDSPGPSIARESSPALSDDRSSSPSGETFDEKRKRKVRFKTKDFCLHNTLYEYTRVDSKIKMAHGFLGDFSLKWLEKVQYSISVVFYRKSAWDKTGKNKRLLLL